MRKIFIVGCLLAQTAWGWNSNGHRIIAFIAYRGLKPNVRRQVDWITASKFYGSGISRFLSASTWPDRIRYQGIQAFNPWHYINIPYDRGVKGPPPAKENVAWAIAQSIRVLQSPRVGRREKAWFLSFLIHFVGDAHQPMHCIELYSKRFPNGDQGGNLFPINARHAHNLHKYWDGGVGLFPASRYLKRFGVENLAKNWMKAYPPNYFIPKVKNRDPWSWTRQGYEIAIKYGYDGLKPDSIPNTSYVRMAQIIVKQRVTLAGYRLAYVLNTVFSQGGHRKWYQRLSHS